MVANEALVNYLADRVPTANVYGLNPGMVKTEIRDNVLGKGSWLSTLTEGLIGLIYPTAEKYANNVLVHAMVSPDLESSSKTLIDSNGRKLNPNVNLTSEVQEKIMTETVKLLERALAKKN